LSEREANVVFKQFIFRSIKTRLAALALVTFLASLWSLALYAYRTFESDLQSVLAEQQFSTVSFIASHINDDLTDRIHALENVAASIDAVMLGNTTALQAHLEKQPILQMLFNAGAFVTLTDGNPIADVPVPAKRIGLSVAERDYIITALEEGRSSVGKPVLGKNLKTPTFSVAAPIRDTQGRVQGVLVGVTSLNAQNFLDNVTRQRYGKTGDYFIASRTHRLNVTSSDKNRIMQALPKPGVNPYVDRFVQGWN
jgi:sensor histidine kinase regulating citrate/malate metabolism